MNRGTPEGGDSQPERTDLPGRIDGAETRVVGASDARVAVEEARGVIQGRYLLIEEIGRGGMGVVYRGYDPKLRREVAIKALHRSGLSEFGRTRLIREARAMAKLSHPNTVAIFDIELERDEVLLAMEYVEGTTLQRWLGDARRDWAQILDHFRAAGRGLAAAHQAGLLHGDFKPANVLLGSDGQVKVADFGLARSISGATPSQFGRHMQHRVTPDDADALRTSTEVAMGTPRYMAPEQHRLGSDITEAADQYAFCVSLWEAITGTAPFEAIDDFDELGRRKEAGPPRWPPDVYVPKWLESAVMRGLDPAPGSRFDTVAALLDALCEPGSQPRLKLRRPTSRTSKSMEPRVVGEPDAAIGRCEAVLYVEDDAQNFEVAHARLRRNFELLHASSDRAACEILSDRSLELYAILMDIQLQGSQLDGIALAKLCRGLPLDGSVPPWAATVVHRPDTPLVFVTAYVNRYSPDMLHAAGGDAVINKPVNFVDLCSTMTRLNLRRATALFERKPR